jgi:hypothetical protein
MPSGDFEGRAHDDFGDRARRAEFARAERGRRRDFDFGFEFAARIGEDVRVCRFRGSGGALRR